MLLPWERNNLSRCDRVFPWGTICGLPSLDLCLVWSALAATPCPCGCEDSSLDSHQHNITVVLNLRDYYCSSRPSFQFKVAVHYVQRLKLHPTDSSRNRSSGNFPLDPLPLRSSAPHNVSPTTPHQRPLAPPSDPASSAPQHSAAAGPGALTKTETALLVHVKFLAYFRPLPTKIHQMQSSRLRNPSNAMCLV